MPEKHGDEGGGDSTPPAGEGTATGIEEYCVPLSVAGAQAGVDAAPAPAEDLAEIEPPPGPDGAALVFVKTVSDAQGRHTAVFDSRTPTSWIVAPSEVVVDDRQHR